MNRIQLQGHSNSWDMPMLKIHLRRNDNDVGWLHVRFPEQITARDHQRNRRVRFYRDSRSANGPANVECEPVELPVKWEGTSQNIGYTMTFDNGFVVRGGAQVVAGTVTLFFVLENHTGLDLSDMKVDTCIQTQHLPDICDFRAKRTLFPVSGRFQSVRSLIPELNRFSLADARAHRFYGYRDERRQSRENPTITPHSAFPDNPDKVIYRWTVPDNIDASAIAIISKDGSWCIATTSENASPVWCNPALSCMHSSPEVSFCEAGTTVQLSNSIHVVPSSLLDTDYAQLPSLSDSGTDRLLKNQILET